MIPAAGLAIVVAIIDVNAGAMSEEEKLRARVITRAGELGLWWLEIPDSRKLAHRGWPDLVLIGPGGVLFRELKATEGSLSEWQLYVLRSLERAGADTGIWRPWDWATGLIERQLLALTRA